MKPTKDKLEKLIAEESPTAAVIKAALEQEKKEADERAVAAVRRQIAAVQEAVDNAVAAVREARRLEKVRMATLRGLSAAQDQFLKDADFVTFKEAAAKVGVYVR